MRERIFKSWKTSILGILLLIGTLALVFWGKATLTEAGAFAPFCITMIFLKDPTRYLDNNQKD